MSTLHEIRFGGEVVHKGRPISTGAFPLNRHEFIYIISSKKAVLQVPTLGCKSTNMQSTDFHNPVGHQYSTGLLVWRQHDMPFQAVTCHFFVEAFIIISRVIYKSLYLQHVSCIDMFRYICSPLRHVTHFLILVAPMHTHTNYCTWAISPSQGIQSRDTGKQMSLTATLFTAHCRSLMMRHIHQTCIHTKEYLSHCSYYRPCPPVYGTNEDNWTMVVTLYDLHYYMNPVNYRHIYTHTHTRARMYIYIYIYIHTHTYIYIYTHIHTETDCWNARLEQSVCF